MVGPPGTGKTTIARAIGGAVGLTVILWNPSLVKDKYQGGSQSKMKQDLDILKAMSPCIVFIDEIDKAFTANDTGQSDGGTGVELLGMLLSFMSDSHGNFFLGTANDVRLVPPALLRTGRWNSMFHVDLPSKRVRDSLMKHYAKVWGVSLSQPLPNVENWTGAEIEALFQQAGTMDMTLMESARYICPISVTMSSEIDFVRKWSQGRARPSELPEGVNGAVEGGRVIESE
jgi:SpoVK/Ycf46/Vps4 family AAA+-type ATPase